MLISTPTSLSIMKTYKDESNRATFWNYQGSGSYHIVMNTKHRAHYFGLVTDGKVQLSKAGKIAYDSLKELEIKFPYCKLKSFVIMPDHVHLLFSIDSDAFEVQSSERKERGGIEKNPMKYQGISAVVRYFKARTCAMVRAAGLEFGWQSNYYDSIVQSENQYLNVQKYIEANPRKWSEKRR